MQLLKSNNNKCTVRSIALYGAETWTTTQAHREKLSAFETWVWRRMEITWVDKVWNDDVLQKVQENSSTNSNGAHRAAWLAAVEHNKRQDVVQSNKKMKVATNAQRLCDSEEKRRKQKQLAATISRKPKKKQQHVVTVATAAAAAVVFIVVETAKIHKTAQN